MGVLSNAPLRLGDRHDPEEFDRPLHCLAAREASVDHEHLGHLEANAEDGVEGAGRLLENEPDPVAAYRAHVTLR